MVTRRCSTSEITLTRGACVDPTQKSVLEDFKTGICNLLIATRIAEDGVEVPPCTCIIRFAESET
jgi:ERCC4-related helicase